MQKSISYIRVNLTRKRIEMNNYSLLVTSSTATYSTIITESSTITSESPTTLPSSETKQGISIYLDDIVIVYQKSLVETRKGYTNLVQVLVRIHGILTDCNGLW